MLEPEELKLWLRLKRLCRTHEEAGPNPLVLRPPLAGAGIRGDRWLRGCARNDERLLEPRSLTCLRARRLPCKSMMTEFYAPYGHGVSTQGNAGTRDH